MTPLSPTRRAADEFARLVDGAPGEDAGRHADLLTFVGALRAQEPPAPRPDFAASLRERLMDAADTLLLPADATPHDAVVVDLRERRHAARNRRLSVAAAALVVVGGTASVAAAAESSLPGDPLYGLKRGIESAQVAFNSSDSSKGQDLLRQASTRLDEVNGLLGGNASAGQIQSTLSSYQSSATDGADLIFVSYQRNGDPTEITRLRTMLASQMTVLDTLSAKSPSGATDAFGQAKALIADLDQQARVLCVTCGPDTPTGLASSSAPASLTTLLAVPAADFVAASAQTSKALHLAQLADHLAQQTPQTTPGSTSTDPSGTQTTPTRPSLPGIPGLPKPTGLPVKDALNGVGDGVNTLLNQLTEPLTPVTDSLTGALNTLGQGLSTPKP